MPFAIVGISPDVNASRELTDAVQAACKKAWASMTNRPCGVVGQKFNESEVGGLATQAREFQPEGNWALRVKFIYVDRGPRFREELGNALMDELDGIRKRAMPSLGVLIELVPTKAEEWFADPSWSQVSCDKDHFGGPREYD